MGQLQSVRRITVEEFATHPSDNWSELVRGEVRLNPPPASRHGFVALRVAVLLNQHVSSRRLGAVFGDGTGFELPHLEATVRGPDVSFVHRDHLPDGGIGEGWLNVAPDLVVEVLSPSESASAIEEKVSDYLTAGTRLVWIVDPAKRGVSVFAAGGQARWLGEDATIDGGDVLPEFAAPIAAFFDGLAPTAK
jgi:Uma2 family endonuclease